jgi:hypothetical protein
MLFQACNKREAKTDARRSSGNSPEYTALQGSVVYTAAVAPREQKLIMDTAATLRGPRLMVTTATLAPRMLV